MRKSRRFLIGVAMVMFLAGCSGLRYHDVSPDAGDFHPRTIAVLPVEVGTYAEAKGVIDQIIAGVLVDRQWFAEVITADAVGKKALENDEFRKAIADYVSKLNAVSFSDPELSRKIGEVAKAEALLVVRVDYWHYGNEGGSKIAKVGLGMKLVDVRTGRIVWTAGHHEADDYTLFKPELPNLAKSVVRKMISNMPH